MSEERALIPALMRQSLSDPRAAARRLVGLDLPADALWQGLVLVVVLSAIAARISATLIGSASGSAQDVVLPDFITSPLLMSFVQGAILVVMVFAVHWVGRAMGGMGRFEDSLAAVVWLQFLLVCLQVVQTVAGVLSPALSSLIGLAGVVLFFWLLTQFVLVVHGFQSAAMVFVMIVVSLLGITFAVSMVLTLLGIAFTGETPNV
jgi:hypothetical protein